jgi:hypothetical protein
MVCGIDDVDMIAFLEDAEESSGLARPAGWCATIGIGGSLR